jgi:hypothetical protein
MSMVLLTTAAEYPQTSLITCSRETTAPLARESASSKADCFAANSTVCDARRAVREAGSTFETEQCLPCRNWSGLWGRVLSVFKKDGSLILGFC